MGELNLALKTYPRILISRPNGTWMDVTRWARTASIDLGDVSGVGTGKTGADGICRMLELSLGNERSGLDGISFSFKDLTSPINQIDGQFAPLLQDGREIILQTAQLPFGIEAMEQDFKTIFHGVLGDDFKATRNGAEIMCRDLSYKASGPHAFMYDVVTYGSEEGTLAETVIQQMFDDVLGAGVLSLYCPETTGWMVKEFTPRYQTPWNVANDIVNQFGWYFGFMTAPDGLYRPHLIEPPRYADVETADFYIDWNGDIKTQSIQTSGLGIRNWIIVRFTDESGERIELNPNDYPELKDKNSIDEYDKRPMLIELDDNSQIKTVEEGLTLGGYALFDLSSKVGTTRVDMPYFQKMDVFKSMVIRNRAISSTDDFYGCLSVRHEFDFSQIPATGTTTFLANGKVVGGHRRWLDRETRVGAPGQPINSGRLDPAPPPVPLGLSVTKDVRVSNTGQIILENVLTWNKIFPQGVEYLIERSNDESNYYHIGMTQRGSERFSDSNIVENTTYYYRVRSRYITTGATSSPGGIQSVTVDQKPGAPGGTLRVYASGIAGKIRVTIYHDNKPRDLLHYQVYYGSSPILDPSTELGLADHAALGSEKLDIVHEIPLPANRDTYIAVRAVNNSLVPGPWVEPQNIPVQARLIEHSDLASQVIRPTIYTREGFNEIELTPEQQYSLISYDKANELVLSFSSDILSVVFEYPYAINVDSILLKIGGDPNVISFEFDGERIPHTSIDYINGLKRYNFPILQSRRVSIKFIIFYQQNVNVYFLKPLSKVAADYGIFGELNANIVKVLSGDTNDEKIELTGSGFENYAKGSDDVIRKAFSMLLGGDQLWYNKENGNLMHQFISSTGSWEVKDGQIIMYDEFGNYSVLNKNHLAFFKAGSDIPHWYTRRVVYGTATDGQLIELNWDMKPKVITAPARLQTYNPDHSGFNQYFETDVQFDANNNPIINGHSFIKGTTYNHSLSPSKAIGPSKTWTTPETEYDTVSKLAVTIHSSNFMIGNKSPSGKIYYKKTTDTNWTLWAEVMVLRDYTRTFVISGLPPATYMMCFVRNNDCEDYWYIISWQEWGDAIISDPSDKIMYIAVEGGAE